VTRLALVAAVATSGVIGRGQALPWHLPEDLRRFKATTLGKPILMGRRTLESIGRALPGRRNLVLTHAAALPVPGIEVVASIAEALERCAADAQLCVIGGAELYRLTLARADEIYLTRVHGDIAGDSYFPPLDLTQWRELERSEWPADDRNAYAMSFVHLERIGPGVLDSKFRR
jgi:dihydrofolate reductase